MRSAYGLALLLCIMGMLASGHVGASQAEVKGEPPDLSGIWWATESFIHPDGRREEWEYVVAIELDGGRLTIADGDGLRLAGTLEDGAAVLRGSYLWSDGTFGRYVLELNASESDCLQAAGSWANHHDNGEPVPGAQGMVSFSFARAGLYMGSDSEFRREPITSFRPDLFASSCRPGPGRLLMQPSSRLENRGSTAEKRMNLYSPACLYRGDTAASDG